MAFHAYIMDDNGNWRLETVEREVVDTGDHDDDDECGVDIDAREFYGGHVPVAQDNDDTREK